MNLVRNYLETDDPQEIIDKLNEKYGYKITKKKVGKILQEKLSGDYINGFLDQEITEDEFLEDMNGLIFINFTNSLFYQDFLFEDEDDFKERLPDLLRELEYTKQEILELSPDLLRPEEDYLSCEE